MNKQLILNIEKSLYLGIICFKEIENNKLTDHSAYYINFESNTFNYKDKALSLSFGIEIYSDYLQNTQPNGLIGCFSEKESDTMVKVISSPFDSCIYEFYLDKYIIKILSYEKGIYTIEFSGFFPDNYFPEFEQFYFPDEQYPEFEQFYFPKTDIPTNFSINIIDEENLEENKLLALNYVSELIDRPIEIFKEVRVYKNVFYKRFYNADIPIEFAILCFPENIIYVYPYYYS